jgi:hypothetical protein
MASASVSRQTAIATRMGWVTPDIGTRTALALDRFGKVVEVGITVSADTAGPVVFLGSRKGFGAFAGGSRIISADGITGDARSMALIGNIGDMLFEATIASLADAFSTVEVTGFWKDLRAIACHDATEEMVVRCMYATGPSTTPAETVIRGDARYLRLSRRALGDDFSKDWRQCVIRLCKALFADVAAEPVCIPVATPLLALWYLTACISQGNPASFAFDSLQYSSFATVSPDASVSPPLAKGGTAFIAPLLDEVFVLQWSDNTINPIANGFILATA